MLYMFLVSRKDFYTRCCRFPILPILLVFIIASGTTSSSYQILQVFVEEHLFVVQIDYTDSNLWTSICWVILNSLMLGFFNVAPCVMLTSLQCHCFWSDIWANVSIYFQSFRYPWSVKDLHGFFLVPLLHLLSSPMCGSRVLLLLRLHNA